jgi:hypothetical protein
MTYKTAYEWEGDGYDPEADPVDLWQRQLTDLKAKRRERERKAEYLSRPFCSIEGCKHRQNATGPLCTMHMIESFEFGGGKL